MGCLGQGGCAHFWAGQEATEATVAFSSGTQAEGGGGRQRGLDSVSELPSLGYLYTLQNY